MVRYPFRLPQLRLVIIVLIVPWIFFGTAYCQSSPSNPTATLTVEARAQRWEGKDLFADGDVDLRYENWRLRSDHLTYNRETRLAVARGHVQFDFDAGHLEADQASLNLGSGKGFFQKVHGTFRTAHRPSPNLLISPNPIFLQAREVERVNKEIYIARHAWLTVCSPNRPKWKFYASRAKILIDDKAKLANPTFQMFSVPVVYLPLANVPVGPKIRQSGFLMPSIGDSSRRGFLLGDSFYWAPNDWMDATVGAELMSKRGWSQDVGFRARPAMNFRIDGSYYGVDDRLAQGGHFYHLGLDSQFAGGWRAVADLNGLSSFLFRLAFSQTFAEAVNSEVHNTAFVANNFRGFSFDIAAVSYRNFLTLAPETSLSLRKAPEVWFSSVDQAPWKRFPLYFSFRSFLDAANRDNNTSPALETPTAVKRFEFAPSVTLPLRWGPWLAATPTLVIRETHYGAQQAPDGTILPQSLNRTTEELTVDLRPPALARIWNRGKTKWKHTIEPEIVYRYVRGVDNFSRFIRFDENDTLTDTNEIEYSVTQRLFRRAGNGQSEQWLSWRIAQKYYFDPTFGGAVIAGERNVFQALDSITPFPFADQPRRVSPVVSDLRLNLGHNFDTEFRTDYDSQKGNVAALGTVLNWRPYRETFLSIGHFSTRTSETLQPRSNQLQAQIGYGQFNRRGLNAWFGFSYDARNRIFQNQVAQISYNGTCCGIAFEVRRLALGSVRTENQFRVSLLIANVGTFGNFRRQ